MSAIKPSIPGLDYEPAPSRRRLIARRATLLGALLICLAAGYWYVPEIRRRIELAYWQRRCLAYMAAADQIALQTPMDRLSPGAPSYNGMKTPPTKGVVPPEWAALSRLIVPPGFVSEGTLFLHERISPGGNRRLVIIDATTAFHEETMGMLYNLNLRIRLVEPGSFWSPPVTMEWPHIIGNANRNVVGEARIYAGQPDSNDASRFTIRMVDIDGFETVFSGRLHDDDVVSLNAVRN